VSYAFEKLRSQTITTQIAVLVVTALVIAHVVIGIAVFALYPRPNPMSSPGAAMIRLGFVAKLLDAASSPDQRAEIMRIGRAEIPELEVGELPQSARHAMHGPQAEDIRSQLGGRLGVFEVVPDGPGRLPRIAIRFPDGSALMAPLAPPRGFAGPRLALIVALAFLACAVTLLSIWATGALTAPLTRFADAAERFTLGRADAPLPERGPREIVRAARAFNEMRERIQRLVEDRTRMLAAISHDLRTPITRLRLRAEEIKPVPLRMQVIRDLDTMQAIANAALSFLRDQATRGTQGKIDLPSLIQAVCDGFSDAGREIAFDGPAHLNVTGDPDQLARAIINLVENGLKFGKSVTIKMHAKQDRAVDIDVQDDGPGIPDAEKLQVLEPFYRGDHARTLNGPDSFGLGLSISRVIAEAHSGSLSLHDAEPTGLTARLTLPLAGPTPTTNSS
jgi:signal transduction histidine kinase